MGYAVLGIDAGVARLMEFSAPLAPAATGKALLAHVIETALAAGCQRLEFFSTPSWRHWPLFRRVGFVMRPSDLHASLRGPTRLPLESWQLVPGEHDVL